jgi:hypothetical protein
MQTRKKNEVQETHFKKPPGPKTARQPHDPKRTLYQFFFHRKKERSKRELYKSALGSLSNHRIKLVYTPGCIAMMLGGSGFLTFFISHLFLYYIGGVGFILFMLGWIGILLEIFASFSFLVLFF